LGTDTSTLRRTLRRLGLLLSIAVIVWAVALFFGMGVEYNHGQESLNGQSTSASLLAPLALFLSGIAGLAVTLK